MKKSSRQLLVAIGISQFLNLYGAVALGQAFPYLQKACCESRQKLVIENSLEIFCR